MTFKVKIDAPMALTLLLIAAVLVVPVVLYFPGAVSFVFIAALLILLWGILTFDYVLSVDRLTVRFGPFRWRFMLSGVRAIRQLGKPYLFRLEYGWKSFAVLSVREPEAFAAAVRQRIPEGQAF